MLVLLMLSACVRVTDQYGTQGHVVDVGGKTVLMQDAETGSLTVKAAVKGSIYETGEQVSVFGTCLNETDGGIVGSTAMMSSWYPNGTVFFQNLTMGAVQDGYFLYSGPMAAVSGTYLTEFDCYVPGIASPVKAFGEWQNPRWVQQIGNMNSTVSSINNTVTNVYNDTQTLQNITNAWFNFVMGKLANITVQVNYTYVNLSSQIQYAAAVANASVDRNDSYLANLSRGIAATVGAPITGQLTVVSDADRARYLKDWNLEAIVYNEYNLTVGYPPVMCYVSTSNSPLTVEAPMTFEGDTKTLLFDQTAKNHYLYKEKIKTTADWNWMIDCHYVS